jgi:hypothetical protein
VAIFRRGEGDNDDFMFVNFRGITGNHGHLVLLRVSRVHGAELPDPDRQAVVDALAVPQRLPLTTSRADAADARLSWVH